MSQRKLARIETVLALDPIPGADRIEAVTISGWKVVAQKGLYQIGGLALFLEIDSLVPRRPWSLFLFKDNRELYRLKSVRLKGQLSQGLLVPITEVFNEPGQLIESDGITWLDLGVTNRDAIYPNDTETPQRSDSPL